LQKDLLMGTIIPHPAKQIDTLDSLVADWLQAKGVASSGSRTCAVYQEILSSYRAELQRVGIDLDNESAEIAPVAQHWAAARLKRGGCASGGKTRAAG
jgi:hypothetical protein